MRNLIQAIILLAFLTNCGEEETKQKCQLVRQKYAAIEYNSKGQVYAIQQLNDANEPVENGIRREFEYEDGKLVRIDERLGETLSEYILFEYAPNQIIQREYWDADPASEYTLTYTLNSEGKILQMVHQPESGASHTHTYEYAGNNVVKLTSTSTNTDLVYTQEFEFDNKRNTNGITGFELYFGYNIFSFLTQNANNITKSTFKQAGEEPEITAFSYTYNSQGYAIERFLNGSTTASWFYDFECK